MSRGVPFAALALAALAALPLARARDVPGDGSPSAGMAVPPLSEAGLPPLPAESPRNANYTIQARLDEARHHIDGRLLLEWTNTTGAPQTTFPFHLYWNAFRNNLSTSARGQGRRAFRAGDPRRWGYTHVRRIALEGGADAIDLTPTLRYVQPDDGNADDRTVMEVTAPAPVPPGATARFRIEWDSLIPHGAQGRAGWVHDYHFIAQWFPKIGVFWKGAWNAHQFHPTTEFFSDFGVYDVSLTVPGGYVVGATGALAETRDEPDGMRTYRFRQADVHDFTWTASRRFLERKARFDAPGYPPVDIRLLLQPEHAHLGDRYLEATKVALKGYGAWSAPYPYAQITVVDPAWTSASGGMEYATLLTGGAGIFSPPELFSPESVTIHEAGHQFWYGLVATNEFEEPWLDEGFNRYHDRKAYRLAYGARGLGTRYFGLAGQSLSGWPVVARGVDTGRSDDIRGGVRKHGRADVMARRAWEFRDADAYGVNAYGKPALSLQTLEGLVGDETMTRILRTYARRYRFQHPTSEDFIATVSEVTGRDWRWFFEETWFSAEECDYAVSVKTARARRPLGYADGTAGPVLAPAGDGGGDDEAGSESEVLVERLGGVRLPVEVLVEFEGGWTVRESWDGQYRWARFRYPRKVVAATVDPEGKIALDMNPSNNGWAEERGLARRAAAKWAARWMFWLQNLLELHAVIG
jgi:peptidase M1-like protein